MTGGSAACRSNPDRCLCFQAQSSTGGPPDTPALGGIGARRWNNHGTTNATSGPAARGVRRFVVVPNRVGSILEPLRGSIPLGAQTRGVAAPPRATLCHPSGVGADPVFTTPTRRTPRRARGLHPGGMAAISPGSAKRHPGFGVK